MSCRRRGGTPARITADLILDAARLITPGNFAETKKLFIPMLLLSYLPSKASLASFRRSFLDFRQLLSLLCQSVARISILVLLLFSITLISGFLDLLLEINYVY